MVQESYYKNLFLSPDLNVKAESENKEREIHVFVKNGYIRISTWKFVITEALRSSPWHAGG